MRSEDSSRYKLIAFGVQITGGGLAFHDLPEPGIGAVHKILKSPPVALFGRHYRFAVKIIQCRRELKESTNRLALLRARDQALPAPDNRRLERGPSPVPSA